MKIKIVIFFTFVTQLIFSQTAIIKGKVVEEANGNPMPAVTVLINGTKFSTVTDAEGNFTFTKLNSGKYDLTFNAFLFESKIVSEVETLTDESTAPLTVSMVEKKNLINEVVVSNTKAKAESIKSLLTMQKNSVRVSDGISSESIKRTPDKTTSDVLKRISGASIQDNKFVIIRGLNDRYNTSYLNGSPLPSSEPDRKAFSFDIFPSNMIDNLVIYKTASPDLPGEFAGGVIEINTKSTPDKDFQTLTIGAGYNTITTGKDQLYAHGGKTDWIGLDNNTRAFPNSFPSVEEFKSLQQNHTQSNILKVDAISKSYTTDWKLYNKNFSPNTNFQFTLGRRYKFGQESNFSFVTSLSNNITNNFNRSIRKTYETPTVLEKDQIDNRYATQTLSAGIANFSLKINSNNTFSFKNLYSINSDEKVIDRSGDLNQESEPLQIHSTARLFRSNTIYTGQLTGEHYLTESKIKINWVGSFSAVKRLTPNDRRNSYIYFKNEDGTFTTPSAYFQINTIGDDSPGSFYSSTNREKIYSTKIDVSKKIKLSETFGSDIKIGYFTQGRNRRFDARQVGYIPFNGNVNGVNYNSNTFDSSISFLNDAQIFNPSNMGILPNGKSGLTLYDGTKLNDSYTASSDLNAAYLMLDNTFYKFRLVWGLRFENYKQDLNSKLDNGNPVVIHNAQTDYLPSLNLIFSVNDKQNIRFSYSKTLNRPEFRELAPFLFYDADSQFNTQGTPNLKIATIQNFDFRYEIFPGKGQLFSISAFYKKFENPIELQALANNSNKYQNAKSGTCKGGELEYRTLLSSIFGTKESKVLDDITLYTNLAIIRSKVDISNLVSSAALTDIPLQGQSPYVFNAGLQYLNKEMGWSSSLNLNKIGDRIYIQGNQTAGAPVNAFWEKSRAFLDFQLAKSFMKNQLELKLNIQNLLAEDLIFYQNNDTSTSSKSGFTALVNNIFTGDRQNKNGYDSSVDDLAWKTKYGRTFSFSISYSF